MKFYHISKSVNHFILQIFLKITEKKFESFHSGEWNSKPLKINFLKKSHNTSLKKERNKNVSSSLISPKKTTSPVARYATHFDPQNQLIIPSGHYYPSIRARQTIGNNRKKGPTRPDKFAHWRKEIKIPLGWKQGSNVWFPLCSNSRVHAMQPEKLAAAARRSPLCLNRWFFFREENLYSTRWKMIFSKSPKNQRTSKIAFIPFRCAKLPSNK